MHDYYFNEPNLNTSIKNNFNPFILSKNEVIFNELNRICLLPAKEMVEEYRNFTGELLIGDYQSIHKLILSQIELAKTYATKLECELFLSTYYSDNLKINNLTGTDFEYFMSRFYYACNYNVETTKLSHDEGVDLILHPRNNPLFTCYVQCKGSLKGQAVSSSIIRDLNGTIHNARVNGGFIATTTHVSKAAMKFIIQNNMLIQVHDFNYITSTLNDMFSW